jgi:hypothetical protein
VHFEGHMQAQSQIKAEPVPSPTHPNHPESRISMEQ